MSGTLTFPQNETIEVRLHGELGRRCGKVWNLAVSSPAEAIRALSAMCKQFLPTVRTLDRAGMVFKIRTDTHEYVADDLEMKLGRNRRIDLIPIVRGASATARFIIGAVIFIVSSVFSFYPGQMLGASMVLGAMAEMMAPVPKMGQTTESKNSWTISGATNPTEQGGPVPVIYGEVVTGGIPISAGLSAVQVNTRGTTEPSCGVVGNANPFVRLGGRAMSDPLVESTVSISYSASAFNLDDPFTYLWTISGFSHALVKSVALSGTTTATLKITIVFLAFNGQTLDVPGTVSLQMTGKARNSNGDYVTHTVNDGIDVLLQYTRNYFLV